MRKIRVGTLDSVAKLMACTCAQRTSYWPLYGRYVVAGAYFVTTLFLWSPFKDFGTCGVCVFPTV